MDDALSSFRSSPSGTCTNISVGMLKPAWFGDRSKKIGNTVLLGEQLHHGATGRHSCYTCKLGTMRRQNKIHGWIFVDLIHERGRPKLSDRTQRMQRLILACHGHFLPQFFISDLVGYRVEILDSILLLLVPRWSSARLRLWGKNKFRLLCCRTPEDNAGSSYKCCIFLSFKTTQMTSTGNIEWICIIRNNLGDVKGLLDEWSQNLEQSY